MICLIIFMVLADGEAKAFALRQPTMQACEAKVADLRREVMGIESVPAVFYRSLSFSWRRGEGHPIGRLFFYRPSYKYAAICFCPERRLIPILKPFLIAPSQDLSSIPRRSLNRLPFHRHFGSFHSFTMFCASSMAHRNISMWSSNSAA